MSLVGVALSDLSVEDLESLDATLGSANFAWVMHELAVADLHSARARLAQMDPGKPGLVGRCQGQVQTLASLPNTAKTLKELIGKTIGNKRKEGESNGG